jgi:probable rRNA maturation factor
MIQIEPDAVTASNRSAIKMRELRSFLSNAKSAVKLQGEVSVLLATDDSIRKLNKSFRKKDKATDVLSFPTEPDMTGGPKLAGDLAVALGVASKQAEEHGHALLVEIKILLLHGLLHLAGYDHETDTGQMARKESALRKQLNLPVGLIQRSVGKTVKQAPQKAVRTKALGPGKTVSQSRTHSRTRSRAS